MPNMKFIRRRKLKSKTMKKRILVSVCAILAVSAATYSQPPASATSEYKTLTGKVITVTETHPQGASLSDISVAFKDNPGGAVQYSDVEPIHKVLVADLDGNGFSEIYIITVSAGSGSYGNVVAVASNKDRSLSQINFPELSSNDIRKGANFEAYEGHDDFVIRQGMLVRTFPVKAPKEASKVVTYKLKDGEAAFQLVMTD
jgi:hypothetical protein